MGRQTGIYTTWAECKKQVDGVVARFKKFPTLEEAQEFMTTSDPRDAGKTRKFNATPTENNTGNKRKNEEDHEDLGKRSKQDYDPDRVVVYTDGCCFSNGRRGAKGGIGVYWSDGDPRNVSESLEGLPTNQRAELNAAIRALEIATKKSCINKLEIRTDSMYTLNAVTKWMNGWKKNGFKTAKGTNVKNRDDIMKLYGLCQKIDVKWTHVRGHQGHKGNEKADELAKKGAEL
ncbi:ribonuclease H1 [Paramuricea clavata]|nr:ribonuclease H1 [Paramuricea clavata]